MMWVEPGITVGESVAQRPHFIIMELNGIAIENIEAGQRIVYNMRNGQTRLADAEGE